MDAAVSPQDNNPLRTLPASEEIITLLASTPNVLEFKPSEAAKARVWDMMAREQAGTLTPQERYELDHYTQMEHIMRLVQAQARRLQNAP